MNQWKINNNNNNSNNILYHNHFQDFHLSDKEKLGTDLDFPTPGKFCLHTFLSWKLLSCPDRQTTSYALHTTKKTFGFFHPTKESAFQVSLSPLKELPTLVRIEPVATEAETVTIMCAQPAEEKITKNVGSQALKIVVNQQSSNLNFHSYESITRDCADSIKRYYWGWCHPVIILIMVRCPP